MKKPSFNKILEAEFEPKKIDLSKIVEDVQHDNFDIDFGEDSWNENGKETTSFEIFHNNETIAYGKIDVNSGEVKVGGSFYSDKLDEAIKDKEYPNIETLQDILSKEIAPSLDKETTEIEEDTTNTETSNTEIPATDTVPTNTPDPNTELTSENEITEEGLDPVEAVKICKTEEELDSLANEYLMPEEYELYIETKPDADFEDNKNFVLHLLTSGDEYESKGE